MALAVLFPVADLNLTPAGSPGGAISIEGDTLIGVGRVSTGL